MLLGKLNTPVIRVYQKNLLESINESGEYMIVAANNFLIGGESVTFDVRFGNIVVENGEERFDPLIREAVVLPTLELSNWGTDDSVLLDIISAKFGKSISEKLQKDIHYTY